MSTGLVWFGGVYVYVYGCMYFLGTTLFPCGLVSLILSYVCMYVCLSVCTPYIPYVSQRDVSDQAHARMRPWPVSVSVSVSVSGGGSGLLISANRQG